MGQPPTTRRYELLCAIMLGFGHLSIMVGYDSGSFVLESVIHSINERNPDVISKYAGYYGQAVMYILYMIGCMFSPSILNEVGSKWILVASAICFASFPLGFFFVNSNYYYFSQMLLGFGYALYYQGNGGYMTSHSTRKTIESNVNIAWSIGCVCLIISSGIFAGVTSMAHAPSPNSNFFFFSRIGKLLFGVFFGASVLGIVNFLAAPGKDVTDCIQETKKKGTFLGSFKQTCTALVDRSMLELFFLFSVLGTSSSFWLSIFPTAMNFTVANFEMTYLCAIYPLGIGIGEIFMALFITQMSRRHKDFCFQPAMILGTVFSILAFFMVHVSTPYDSPHKPTREDALWFGHSYFFIFLIGVTLGIGDCCLNSCRSVICALAMPDRRAQAFSISKLYQALGSCFLFFLSPIIPLYVYTIGISVHLIIAMIFFFITARRTQNMEKKNDENEKNEEI
ncbi:Protein CBG24830 [Caenorhabditis briggsae]|uniref:Protein CBG24830 n=1 Tax=Caenorhabditis briggsae TaxID=6238 RepID=A8WLL1_CAEBR|nr:Protein CBG24830 [Caenorhabditis briggsae]CAP21356.1 Protein CBG24830 [Caenorhabditis briggsae]